MIKKENIDIYKADRKNSRFYLSIVNKEYNIFRAFKTINELIGHLKKYPIENKEEVLKQIIIK